MCTNFNGMNMSGVLIMIPAAVGLLDQRVFPQREDFSGVSWAQLGHMHAP